MALAVFFTGWAASKPVGSDTDDHIHLMHAWCGENGSSGRCERDHDNYNHQFVPKLITDGMSCSSVNWDYWNSARCQNRISTHDMISVLIVDYGHYPSLFKDIQGLLVSENIVVSVFRIRLLGAVLFVFAVGAGLFATKGRNVNTWFYLVVVCSPSLISMVASANPMSFSYSAAVGFALLHLRLERSNTLKGHLHLGVIGASLSFAFLAWNSRPDSRLSITIAGFAYCTYFLWRWIRGEDRSISKGVAIVGITVSTSLLLIYAEREIRRFLIFPANTKSDAEPANLLIQNLFRLPQFLQTALFGDPHGSYATGVSPKLSVWLSSTSLICLLILCRSSKSKRSPLPFFYRYIPLLAVCAAVLVTHQIVGEKLLESSIHPRYFLPYIALALAAPIKGLELHRRKMTVLLISISASCSTVIAIAANIYRYVAGINPDGLMPYVVPVLTLDWRTTEWEQSVIPVNTGILFVAMSALALRLYAIGPLLIMRHSHT